MTRKRARYEQVFIDTNGSGSHACYFCTTEVTDEELVIHHLDHNEENDEPENLVPCHRLCHGSYHFKCKWVLERDKMMQNRPGRTGMPHTDETKRKISEAKTGNVIMTSETIEKIVAKTRGLKRSDEFRVAASERASNRSPEHQEKLNAAQRGKKRSPEARERMRQAALARHARQRAEEGGGTGDGAHCED